MTKLQREILETIGKGLSIQHLVYTASGKASRQERSLQRMVDLGWIVWPDEDGIAGCELTDAGRALLMRKVTP